MATSMGVSLGGLFITAVLLLAMALGGLALVVLGVWLVTRPGQRRQEEMHRHELELLEGVRQGLERMDGRVAALEGLLPSAAERKEASQ